MIIDFDAIEKEVIMGFKGGEGELDTRNYVDADMRIMRSSLFPGARSGEHQHDVNCEVMYVLKGELTVHCDGKTEVARAGEVHYCAKGHSHWFENRTSENVEYFAIVPTKLL